MLTAPLLNTSFFLIWTFYRQLDLRHLKLIIIQPLKSVLTLILPVANATKICLDA